MQFSTYNYVMDEKFSFLNSFAIFGDNVSEYCRSATEVSKSNIIFCKKCHFFLTPFNSRFTNLELNNWFFSFSFNTNFRKWKCDKCNDEQKLDPSEFEGYRELSVRHQQNPQLFTPINLAEDYFMMMTKRSGKAQKCLSYIYVLDFSQSISTQYNTPKSGIQFMKVSWRKKYVLSDLD